MNAGWKNTLFKTAINNNKPVVLQLIFSAT
jgi:hypothetical protein